MCSEFAKRKTEMIHIKEIFPDENSVAIMVDGILDRESIDLLERLCLNHNKAGRSVSLHLKDLLHISRAGMEFLQQIRNMVVLVDIPKFIK